jgi:hypothetical protein
MRESVAQARGTRMFIFGSINFQRRFQMPIILWLLGVPISVVLLLMLFGVF